MDDAPLVEARGVWKRFGGVQALRDVSLAIGGGVVHGLVGENGAGKSTLGKLIAGVHRADDGELYLRGRRVDYHSPREALDDGVTLIAQELALVPQRSVLENVFLGIEPHRLGLVDRRALRRRFQALDVLGFGLEPDVRVGELRLADRQKVEIMRSLAREAQLIVMDEPTASLSPNEAGHLFEIVRQLAADGTTVVFVSHFLDDVLSLCDHVTILRDGAVVRTSPAAEETSQSLVTGMIGRSLETTFPPRQPPPAEAPVVLSVEGLDRTGRFADVSFDVRRGEIVGLAGLVGSGRSSVARAIFGADRPTAGTIELDGRPVSVSSPRAAVRLGIALLPESRGQGLVLVRSIVENVSLPHLDDVSTVALVLRREERRAVGEALARVGAPAGSLSAPVRRLSGGNQQKVLFSKWLFTVPRVLIADDPTRGVDVGAKAAIYELLGQLAAAGLAIVLISSEHEELLGLAHRVIVMRAGQVAGELSHDEASTESVLRLAFGTRANEDAAA